MQDIFHYYVIEYLDILTSIRYSILSKFSYERVYELISTQREKIIELNTIGKSKYIDPNWIHKHMEDIPYHGFHKSVKEHYKNEIYGEESDYKHRILPWYVFKHFNMLNERFNEGKVSIQSVDLSYEECQRLKDEGFNIKKIYKTYHILDDKFILYNRDILNLSKDSIVHYIQKMPFIFKYKYLIKDIFKEGPPKHIIRKELFYIIEDIIDKNRFINQIKRSIYWCPLDLVEKYWNELSDEDISKFVLRGDITDEFILKYIDKSYYNKLGNFGVSVVDKYPDLFNNNILIHIERIPYKYLKGDLSK